MTKRRDPKYRHHKARNLAVVRIDGKDYYLGRFGSDESKTKYYRLLADWRAGLLDPVQPIRYGQPDNQRGNPIPVVDLVRLYERFSTEYHQKDGVPLRRESKSRYGISEKRLGTLLLWILGLKR